MELRTKLYLVDEEGRTFMGIGVYWLLLQIREQKSLRSGAAQLGISYSKAFAMVRNLEKEPRSCGIVQEKGGASRDGATLNEFGMRFVDLYGTFVRRAKERVLAPYDTFRTDLSRLIEETGNDDGHGGTE